MANKILSRGQITIVDLNDARQVSLLLNVATPTQMYNPDTKVYTPNFNISPNTITPKVYVSGKGDNQVTSLTALSYTINGTEVKAGASSGNYKVAAISTGGALTISGNISTENSLNIICKATYQDSLTKVDTIVEAQTQVIKSTSAGALFQVVLTQPKGNSFDAQTNALTAFAECYRGGVKDTDGITYKWQSLNFTNGQWVDVSSGVSSSGGASTLTVKPDDVLNVQTFKVIAQDGNDRSEQIVTFEDRTDPYEVVIHAPKGNVIMNGKGDVTLYAEVWQNGTKVEDANTSSKKFTYTWTKYNAQGAPSNFAGGSSSTKTGNPLTITAADVDSKATFVCQISK